MSLFETVFEKLCCTRKPAPSPKAENIQPRRGSLRGGGQIELIAPEGNIISRHASDDEMDFDEQDEDLLMPSKEATEVPGRRGRSNSNSISKTSSQGLFKKRVTKSWSPAEDHILSLAIQKHQQKNWREIAKDVPSRTASQCFHRWQRMAPKEKRRPWTKEEDETVVALAKELHCDWSAIALRLDGRNGKQVRDRYLNVLNPTINKSKWEDDEDKQLMDLFMAIGPRWSEIAARMNGRSENMVKNRYYSHIRKNFIQAGELHQNFSAMTIETDNLETKGPSTAQISPKGTFTGHITPRGGGFSDEVLMPNSTERKSNAPSDNQMEVETPAADILPVPDPHHNRSRRDSMRRIGTVQVEDVAKNNQKILEALMQSVSQQVPQISEQISNVQQAPPMALPPLLELSRDNSLFSKLPPVAGSEKSSLVSNDSISKYLELGAHDYSRDIKFLLKERAAATTEGHTGYMLTTQSPAMREIILELNLGADKAKIFAQEQIVREHPNSDELALARDRLLVALQKEAYITSLLEFIRWKHPEMLREATQQFFQINSQLHSNPSGF